MIGIVLAAGYATRMYPLTEHYPKPLLEVQGKPILDWLLEDMVSVPCLDRVMIVSNHKFYEHFQHWLDQNNFRIPVSLLDDGSETNEARKGAVKDIQIALEAAEPTELSGGALVVAGDNLLEFSFKGFVQYYDTVGCSCIMAYPEPDIAKQRKTGIITVAEDGQVTSFEEKPQNPKADLAVPPFYCYTPSDLARISDAIRTGCPTDAPGSLAAWMSVHSTVYAWQMPGKRYDIGSLEGYRAVQREYRPMKATVRC